MPFQILFPINFDANHFHAVTSNGSDLTRSNNNQFVLYIKNRHTDRNVSQQQPLSSRRIKLESTIIQSSCIIFQSYLLSVGNTYMYIRCICYFQTYQVSSTFSDFIVCECLSWLSFLCLISYTEWSNWLNVFPLQLYVITLSCRLRS